MQSGSLTLTGSVLLVAPLVNAPGRSLRPLKRYRRRLRVRWSESCGADRLCRSSMSYSVTGLTPRHQLFPREEPGVVPRLELPPYSRHQRLLCEVHGIVPFSRHKVFASSFA